MDSSSSDSRSPRKELQGPRPPALKVRKDSHQIRKPPVAPKPNPNLTNPPIHHQLNQQPRAPVIIYTVSPKVIHTNPDDFMTLVQRLTGPSTSSSSSSSAAASSNPFSDDGAPSPAARYAAIEKTRSPKGNSMVQQQSGNLDFGDFFVQEVEMGPFTGIGFPQQGILSPGPALLPPVPPSFFSPQSTTDPSSVGYFHDFSPGGLHSSRNFMDGTGLLPSPGNFFAGFSPRLLNSPFPSVDLFNNFNSGNFDF